MNDLLWKSKRSYRGSLLCLIALYPQRLEHSKPDYNSSNVHNETEQQGWNPRPESNWVGGTNKPPIKYIKDRWNWSFVTKMPTGCWIDRALQHSVELSILMWRHEAALATGRNAKRRIDKGQRTGKLDSILGHRLVLGSLVVWIWSSFMWSRVWLCISGSWIFFMSKKYGIWKPDESRVKFGEGGGKAGQGYHEHNKIHPKDIAIDFKGLFLDRQRRGSWRWGWPKRLAHPNWECSSSLLSWENCWGRGDYKTGR